MENVQVKVNFPVDEYYGQVGTVVDDSIVSGQTKFANVPNGSWIEVLFQNGEQFSIQKKDLSLAN